MIIIATSFLWLLVSLEVYTSSVISKLCINRELKNGTAPLCECVIVPGQEPVPVCFSGGAAYLPLPFLIKEFASCGKNSSEHYCGHRLLLKARIVIENSFSWLRGRFGWLENDAAININNLPHFILSVFLQNDFGEELREKYQSKTLKQQLI